MLKALLIAIIVIVALVVLFYVYVRSYYYWIPATIRNPLSTDKTILTRSSTPIVPEGYQTNFGAADPFVVGEHVFAEIMKGGKGIIGVAETTGSKLSFTPVLEEDFHLSYPQVFSHDNEWYMIPEAHQSGSILLYKAVGYPKKWDLVRKISDIDGVDPTIFRLHGCWYIFVASAESHETFLLKTDHFPAGPWEKAVRNPLPKGYRGGGSALYWGGDVVLPVQPPTPFLRPYGQKLELHRIAPDLSFNYIKDVTPPPGAGGLHHLSCLDDGNECMVDLRRYKRV